MSLDHETVWHDVECGAYAADLELWQRLAERSAGRDGRAAVLDLGCGTGRVTLSLARAGHRVTGLDLDPGIVAALVARAREQRLEVATAIADATAFALDRRFDLVLAPMQLIQLFPGPAERRGLLRCARAHLRPGGRFAAALLDLGDEPIDGDYVPPLPDIREVAGWVYSSQAVAIRVLDGGEAISLDRVRRAVSPQGELSESSSSVRLELTSPIQLEDEAAAAGLAPSERIRIPPTDDHVGSIVVVAVAGDG
jgi:SAM-dependent methyltransferase